MSETISQADNLIISNLKKQGVLLRFKPEEFSGSSKNGGVAVMCSDGDFDAPFHHAKLTHRPHCIRLFGGPLLFAKSFGGFRPAFAVGLLENLRQGMTVKDTRTLFLYFHAPCGMATAHNHGIEEQAQTLAPEAREFFASDNFFVQNRIHLLFHVKRINKAGVLEQNTYKIVI